MLGGWRGNLCCARWFNHRGFRRQSMCLSSLAPGPSPLTPRRSSPAPLSLSPGPWPLVPGLLLDRRPIAFLPGPIGGRIALRADQDPPVCLARFRSGRRLGRGLLRGGDLRSPVRRRRGGGWLVFDRALGYLGRTRLIARIGQCQRRIPLIAQTKRQSHGFSAAGTAGGTPVGLVFFRINYSHLPLRSGQEAKTGSDISFTQRR